MAAWESPRGNTCTLEAPLASTDWTLPLDLLLEIVARSDVSTAIAFTAASKLLRGDILNPSFIRHLTQRGGIVPPCILAYLNVHDPVYNYHPPPPISLVHPATPAALAFLNNHLSTSVSRGADDLLAEYHALTSRGGLVLFRRRHASDKLRNFCVYDPLSGHRTFFSDPLCIGPTKRRRWFPRYVLLTAEDGIDCSFLIFVLDHILTVPGDMHASTIQIHTATSTSNTWAPAITSHYNSRSYSRLFQALLGNFVVLQSGVIHWLAHERGEIFSYNIRSREHGTIKLPGPVVNFNGEQHLGLYYSHDGKKLLRFLTYNRFKISMWHQLSNGDWASEAVMIDIEEKLQSLDPDGRPYQKMNVYFESSGEKSNVVLLRINIHSGYPTRTLLIILDLETKEMREDHFPTPSSVLMEIDLSSRLRAMKVFP